MLLSASVVCVLQRGYCKGDHQHRVRWRVKANRWHMAQGEVAWRGHGLPEGYALLSVAPVQVALLLRQTTQVIGLTTSCMLSHCAVLICNVVYCTNVQYFYVVHILQEASFAWQPCLIWTTDCTM